MLGEGRVYGGLHKPEPKELANFPAAEVAVLLPGTFSKPHRQRELFDDAYSQLCNPRIRSSSRR